MRYPPLRYYLERVLPRLLRDMGGGVSRSGPLSSPSLEKTHRMIVVRLREAEIAAVIKILKYVCVCARVEVAAGVLFNGKNS